MILIAAFFYLPGHVTEMLRRAWFYYAGDENMSAGPGAVGASAGGGDVGAMGREQKGVGGRSRDKMAGQDVLDMLGRL